MDVALLILRVVVGLYLIAHGTQKLFGWPGGGGLTVTSGHFQAMGFRPTRLWALAAGLSEAGGGLLFVLGLLTPLGSIGIIAAMLVAIIVAHLGKGWFSMTGGPELPLAYIGAAVAVLIAGSGRYALDAVLGISLPQPVTSLVLLVLTLIGVAVSLLTRSHQPSAAGESSPSAA